MGKIYKKKIRPNGTAYIEETEDRIEVREYEFSDIQAKIDGLDRAIADFKIQKKFWEDLLKIS